MPDPYIIKVVYPGLGLEYPTDPQQVGDEPLLEENDLYEKWQELEDLLKGFGYDHPKDFKIEETGVSDIPEFAVEVEDKDVAHKLLVDIQQHDESLVPEDPAWFDYEHWETLAMDRDSSYLENHDNAYPWSMDAFTEKEGQATDFAMEQSELIRAIEGYRPRLGNLKEWVQAVKKSTTWAHLKTIWDALWGEKEEVSKPEKTHEYQEFLTLEEGGDDAPLELAKKCAKRGIDTGDRVTLPTGEEADVKAVSGQLAYCAPVGESAGGSWHSLNSLTVAKKVVRIAQRKEVQASESTTVHFEDVAFDVAVASTPEEQARGLEVVSSLQENEGMIFPYSSPSHVTFHMGRVTFPIDILFIQDSTLGLKVAKVIHNAQPKSLDHWSCDRTSVVLELNGGTCKKHGIKFGSLCKIENSKLSIKE